MQAHEMPYRHKDKRSFWDRPESLHLHEKWSAGLRRCPGLDQNADSCVRLGK